MDSSINSKNIPSKKIFSLVHKLLEEAKKSDLMHKHACIAVIKGKQISPTFHNYMRSNMFYQNCGSAHAEMATVNYLLNSLWRERWYKKRPRFLQDSQ